MEDADAQSLISVMIVHHFLALLSILVDWNYRDARGFC